MQPFLEVTNHVYDVLPHVQCMHVKFSTCCLAVTVMYKPADGVHFAQSVGLLSTYSHSRLLRFFCAQEADQHIEIWLSSYMCNDTGHHSKSEQ